jgi:predicted AAA+ superfamily ATPase
MFKRNLEKYIREYNKSFPAVAILGARQVGKTTLARQVISKSKKYVYVDLEDADDFNALSNIALFLKSHRNELVVIDEVQRMPKLFPALRAEIDANRKANRFLLLGSASPELLKHSSETLAGRIIYTELSSLIYSEVKDSYTMNEHWLKGGYPEALRQKKLSTWNAWMKSFVRTYVEKDLPNLGLSSPAFTLTRLLQMLAYNQGQMLNKSEYAKALNISVPTVSNMLDYLHYAYLIRVLPAYATNVNKRISKTPKVYLRDTGMLHHLLNVGDMKSLLANPKVGFSWEGYVLENIITKIGDAKNYFYYRTQDGTEADLVICHYDKPEQIVEVKMNSDAKITKSLLNSMTDLKVAKATIIVAGNNINYKLQKGIIVNSLDVFLK